MVEDIFSTLPMNDEAANSRLHARLAAAAADEGLLDIAYRTFDTPVGKLLLAATENGVVRIAYSREDHDKVLGMLSEAVSPRILRSPSRLDALSRQLDEYFAGRRQEFDVPLDFRLSKGFRRAVLTHLRDIAYGTTESYRQVAVAVGSANAVRAAGTACATNPLPLVVPCHRVVRSDGSPGQYAGGQEAKKALLQLEAS
jgi:methylated-DNA-[protein]-cysteine S-methyltransferase